MQVQIVTEFTKAEVILEVRELLGTQFSERAFYRWLPYAGIEPKRFYSRRDILKLAFIGYWVARRLPLQEAKQRLIAEIKTNPEKFR
jgi:hypothetical protein